MVHHTETPHVNGVAPETLLPGDRVIIRGQNLGLNVEDLLAVYICAVDCTLSAQWQSSSKIISRCLCCVAKKGEVIVVTKSGGVGTCNVELKVAIPPVDRLTKLSAWIDEAPDEDICGSSILTPSPAIRPSHGWMQQDESDPLGLLSDVERKYATPLEMVAPFSGTSYKITAPNFSPARLLLESYAEVSAVALQEGFTYLQRKMTVPKQDPEDVLRANIGTIIEAMGSVRQLRSLLKKDGVEYKCESLCTTLASNIQKCVDVSDNMFKGILARKDVADAKRSTLNILQRFKLLFSLRSGIERNIEQGEYDIVISDYNRVRALFQDTDVGAFKNVLAEIEDKVDAFRKILAAKLLNFPSTLERQKQLVRCLVELGSTGDPAWDLVQAQFQWSVEYLSSTRDRVLVNDAAGYKTLYMMDPAPPTVLTYLVELNRSMEDLCSDFWKLGQAYLNNSIVPPSLSGKSTDLTSPSHSKVFKLVEELVLHYISLVRAAFLPTTVYRNPSSGLAVTPWSADVKLTLSESVQLVSCVHALVISLLRFVPREALLVQLLSLLKDTCSLTVAEIFARTGEMIAKLYHTEDWMLTYHEGDVAVTYTPLAVEVKVRDCISSIQTLKETLSRNQHTTHIMLDNLPLSTAALMESCLRCFKSLVMVALDTSSEHPLASVRHLSPDSTRMNSVCERLLAAHSDIWFWSKVILVRCKAYCLERGLKECADVMDKHSALFLETSDFALNRYIAIKSELLLGSIQPGMYIGGFSWSSLTMPGAVRNYIKDLLRSVVCLHEEVSRVSLAYVPSVFIPITTAVASEMLRLMSSITAFSPQGAAQAVTELKAIMAVFQPWLIEHSRSVFFRALQVPVKLTKVEGLLAEGIEAAVELFLKQSTFYRYSLCHNKNH